MCAYGDKGASLVGIGRCLRKHPKDTDQRGKLNAPATVAPVPVEVKTGAEVKTPAPVDASGKTESSITASEIG